MIDQRLIASALEAVDTTNFERFAQAFYGAIQDREFVPLGGIHDGAAEGFEPPTLGDPELFEDETTTSFLHICKQEATSFLQVSKQETTRKKIRATLKRLREYGRNPRVVTYVTSQVISDIDKEELLLSRELKCKISIRDAKYIEAYINSNGATQGAFYSYLQPSISYMFNPGVSNVGLETHKYIDRTLAVFLRQEVDNRRSKNGLMQSITDSLIIWALRDTDPDPTKGILLTRSEILDRIETALPTSKSFVRGALDHRLYVLSTKNAPGGRQIRHYRTTSQYCLPFETRRVVAIENADDDLLKTRVTNVFEARLRNGTNEDIDDVLNSALNVCHSSLEKVFEHQGLKLAQFVVNSAEDDELFTDVAAIATSVVEKLDASNEQKTRIRRYALFILRGTFYKSSEEERLYPGKLSRTYVLMLLLKNEPNVVQYFSSLASKFNLYLGSDIIIRALSEIYLDSKSQTTINLLKILKAAGAKLTLSQKTVEEIATHIRRQIFEYENAYAANDHRITLELVEYIDRLLIRAYFYAKLSPVDGVAPPKGWRAYVSQFCNYDDVRSNIGDEEFADYLIRKFGLIYESTEQMLNGIDPQELDNLTADIQLVRERGGWVKAAGDILAYNDALQVLRIYQKRIEKSENSPGNPFGFETWWLTQDGKVRRGAARAVASHGGKFFMMRPEFLINYIGLSPSLAEVHKSFETVFPSALGVRLSAGIRTEEFDKVMRDAAELAAVDDARAGAMITALTNKLKGDTVKIFDNKW